MIQFLKHTNKLCCFETVHNGSHYSELKSVKRRDKQCASSGGGGGGGALIIRVSNSDKQQFQPRGRNVNRGGGSWRNPVFVTRVLQVGEPRHLVRSLSDCCTDTLKVLFSFHPIIIKTIVKHRLFHFEAICPSFHPQFEWNVGIFPRHCWHWQVALALVSVSIDSSIKRSVHIRVCQILNSPSHPNLDPSFNMTDSIKHEPTSKPNPSSNPSPNPNPNPKLDLARTLTLALNLTAVLTVTLIRTLSLNSFSNAFSEP